MSKPKNPHAFPGTHLEFAGRGLGSMQKAHHPGMTLRDYFAGQVIISLDVAGVELTPEGYAHRAYVIADAMLKEREK